MKAIVLDVETTGKERATDQVIELCVQQGLGADASSRVWRILPSVPIHPEATAVHGIKLEDLVDCPTFEAAAAEIRTAIEEADVIAGYNVAFDCDMLQAEFSRAKLPPLALGKKIVVDALRLWQHFEPRTLVAAHEKFCGAPLINAHQASADVAATARVLTSMLETFGLTGKEWPEIAAVANPFSSRQAWIGPSFHIQHDDRGGVIFGFGKHKGHQVDQADPGFLRWVIGKDFPPHVKKICEVALERRRQFATWIAQYYPRPSLKDDAVDIEDIAQDNGPLFAHAQESAS